MKSLNFLSLAFASMLVGQAHAYDFSSVAKDIVHDYDVNLYFSVNSDGNSVSVTKGPEVYSFDYLKLPETVENDGKTYTVTAIGAEAFYNSKIGILEMANTITDVYDDAFANSSVDSIAFSKGLKRIGARAFNRAQDLRSAVLPEGLETIGNSAFQEGGYYNTTGLRLVVIPNSVVKIGEFAFSYQLNLNQVSLPEGLQQIEKSTFYYCPSLEHISLPSPLVSIGESAFASTGLKSVSFPSKLESVGNKAFEATGLREVVLPDNITEVGESAFASNQSLESITFSKGMKVVPASVCSGCSVLAEVNIPEGVENVAYGAFKGCALVSNVDFPETVTSIGDAVFYQSGITRFEFPSAITVVPNSMFAHCDQLIEFVVPEGFTAVGASAFAECANLAKVILPETLTSIGNGTFQRCEDLAEVNLPQSLTVIGENAFSDCKSVSIIEIPGNLNELGAYAFSSCSGITEITLPHSLERIGQFAFDGCVNLKELHIQRAVLPLVLGLANYPKMIHSDNSCTLYVPRGAKAVYEESPVWNNFMQIEEEDVPDVYYQITASVASGRGAVTVDGEPVYSEGKQVLMGDASVVLVTPAEGYMIEKILCNGEEVAVDAEIGAPYTYNIESVLGNHKIEVYFKELPVTLHLRMANGGSVDFQIEKGGTYACDFTVDEGWKINCITFNGADVTADWTEGKGYVTPSLQAESTLSVSFEVVNGLSKVKNNDIKAYSTGDGTVVIEGAPAGDMIQIYTLDGVLVETVKSAGYNSVSLNAGTIYIIKVSEKVIKIAL